MRCVLSNACLVPPPDHAPAFPFLAPFSDSWGLGVGWFGFGRRVAVGIRLVLSVTISGAHTRVHSHSSTNFQILGELGLVLDCGWQTVYQFGILSL